MNSLYHAHLCQVLAIAEAVGYGRFYESMSKTSAVPSAKKPEDYLPAVINDFNDGKYARQQESEERHPNHSFQGEVKHPNFKEVNARMLRMKNQSHGAWTPGRR